MALKDLDDTNPRGGEKNWKSALEMAQMPKLDEWYRFRLVGGVFSFSQHWIEFVNKDGQTKRFPTECPNWDQETETNTKPGGCPACEAGIKASPRYMINVIDRQLQEKDPKDCLRALELPPTVLRKIIDLKKLNVIKGKAVAVTNKKYGCDIALQKVKKAGWGTEWQVQKLDRVALDEDELKLTLVDFEEFYLEPDPVSMRADLIRVGVISAGNDSTGGAQMPSKKSLKEEAADDEEDIEDTEETPAPAPKKRKKKKRKAPPPPPPEEDDEDDDEDEDEAEAPPASPVADEDDDDDDLFGDDDDDDLFD